MPKILVVDDEADIAESLKRGLELQGLQVDVFNDPRKALDHYKPHVYDMAVLDIRMPGMNGFQLYREIMKQDGDTKVVFVTAFDETLEELWTAFPELDERRFMRKPFTLNKLKERVMEGISTARVSARGVLLVKP